MVMLTIIPTRGRPDAMVAQLADIRETSEGTSDFIYAVDNDDPLCHQYIEAFMAHRVKSAMIRVDERRRMLPTLNQIARSFADQYSVIGFMGDDHRPRTNCWDMSIVSELQRAPGVVYCDDLLQRERLATAVWMTSDIIKALGYMCPPELVHLYADDFWMELGRATRLTYLRDIVIEHMHPTAGKSEWDPGYVEVNSPEMFNADKVKFDEYMTRDWEAARLVARGAVGM